MCDPVLALHCCFACYWLLRRPVIWHHFSAIIAQKTAVKARSQCHHMAESSSMPPGCLLSCVCQPVQRCWARRLSLCTSTCLLLDRQCLSYLLRVGLLAHQKREAKSAEASMPPLLPKLGRRTQAASSQRPSQRASHGLACECCALWLCLFFVLCS